MPRSVSYFFPGQGDDEDRDDDGDSSRPAPITAPPSPTAHRRDRLHEMSETTSLLHDQRGRTAPPRRSYTTSGPPSPRPDTFLRQMSTTGSMRKSRYHSRQNSQNMRFRPTGTPREGEDITASQLSASFQDERVWYDQFTSTDWVHDSIADGLRVRELRRRQDFMGKLLAWFDATQGWILVAVIGCITALFAYVVDVGETMLFDLKEGFCTGGWFKSRKRCCGQARACSDWSSWSSLFNTSHVDSEWVGYVMFIAWVVVLSMLSCALTLLTKTVVPSSIHLSTLDENLGADRTESHAARTGTDFKTSPSRRHEPDPSEQPATVYYSAAGSGVAEVKVILSGFVLHGYLGLKTLIVKTVAMILSVASGLSLGKEGPYVHMAASIGNICCRIFPKYYQNDGKRREVLSASAAGGLSVAFGAPIGGVLFSLEEVSYYFPPKTLFRTFFCCICAALSLKFLDPYGTGKIVLFSVRYLSDWDAWEMIVFIFLGIMGGAIGALFVKSAAVWARTFRRIPIIKKWPMFEVFLVALVTGLTSYWNRYTKLPIPELLFELSSACKFNDLSGLCPEKGEIPGVIFYLLAAFVIKALLTIITFGIKVPAGIYIPSMVVGGLFGRMVGHCVQYVVVNNPNFFLWSNCATGGMESCVTPGVYAMVAAGATMCGVTRLSVTLAVILFELTGSLDHVLPFSVAVLSAKWTADAIEPHSIYDMLTDMNSYPFLDNKTHPNPDLELSDIVPRLRKDRIIDISNSPLVPAVELRRKLDMLLMAGEVDGGLPILRDNTLVGLIPAPDLEYALDKLEDEENDMCLMTIDSTWGSVVVDDEEAGPTDFTPYIDPAPVALDARSPIDLVYQCFVKLGLRNICVLREGEFAGLVHKKTFVKFMKDMEKEEQRR